MNLLFILMFVMFLVFLAILALKRNKKYRGKGDFHRFGATARGKRRKKESRKRKNETS